MPVILVADDEAIIRHLIVQALVDAGYEAITAADGGEALAQARECRPDLILLDYHMPMIEGDVVLKRIRNTPFLAKIPVIMLTSADQKSDVLSLSQHGLDGYILKSSFDVTDLLSRIDQVLACRAEQHESKDIPTDLSQTTNQEAMHHGRVDDAIGKLKEVKQLLSGEEFRTQMRSYEELPALSPVIQHVKTLSRKASTTRDDLAGAVHLDPGLSTCLLHETDNEADLNTTSLESVIVRMGIRQIASIAESVEQRYDFECETPESALHMQHLWEHAVLCGRLTASIMLCHGDSAQEARMGRLVGSLRYSDRLLIMTGSRDQYKLVIQSAQDCRVSLNAAERHLLAWHPKIIAQNTPALRKLPKPVRDAIAQRLDSPEELEALDPDRFKFSSAVELADRLAKGALAGEGLDRIIEPTYAWARALSIKPELLDESIRNGIGQFADDKMRLKMHSDTFEWMEPGKQHQLRLEVPVQALYINQVSGVDAHQLFLEAISTKTPNQKPNLVVVLMHNTSACEMLTKQVLKFESEHGTGPLPLLVLSPKGAHRLREEHLGSRPITLAPSALHADQLIDWINDLLKMYIDSDRGYKNCTS